MLILAGFNSRCGVLPYVRLPAVTAARTVCAALRKGNLISLQSVNKGCVESLMTNTGIKSLC